MCRRSCEEDEGRAPGVRYVARSLEGCSEDVGEEIQTEVQDGAEHVPVEWGIEFGGGRGCRGSGRAWTFGSTGGRVVSGASTKKAQATGNEPSPPQTRTLDVPAKHPDPRGLLNSLAPRLRNPRVPPPAMAPEASGRGSRGHPFRRRSDSLAEASYIYHGGIRSLNLYPSKTIPMLIII